MEGERNPSPRLQRRRGLASHFRSTELAKMVKTSVGLAGSLVFIRTSNLCLPPMPGAMMYGKVKLVD